MTDPLELIETALQHAGKRVARRGDTLQAQCPAHPDNNPSLSISRGTTQPVILTCHAGCDTNNILTALDLDWKDISQPTTTAQEQPITYLYQNADGTPRYRVIRTPDKRFWQQHPDPDTGEWVNGITGIERTLYRHPELKQAIAAGKPIWIVEGEKDVDRLHREGHTATCNSGGAGKFTDDLADLLTGAAFINIVADNDQPGHAHAEHIAQLLTDRGIPHDMWLPAEGKDISDHLNRQHPITALTPYPTTTSDTVDDLAHLINWDTFWTQTHNDEQWIAWPLIPAARTISLYAPAKAGKSTILLSVIASACTGTPPLNNRETPQDPVAILYLDYEMSEADLHERLTALGYGPTDDLTRLHYALLPSLPPLDTPEGGQHLHQLATRLNVNAVVVDTIGRAVEGEENSADTIRAFYRHTAQQLKQAGIAVLRTDHSGKDADKGQRGTSAKNDDVDIVYRLTRTQTGVTLQRTHSRITWAPDNIPIDYTETDDGTVTVQLAATKTFPDGTAPIAKLLDDLDIPLEQGMRKTAQQLRDAGHHHRNSLIRAAVQMRREQHLRTDPFGLPKPVENPVDNNGAHLGAHPSEPDGAHPSGTPTKPNEYNGAHLGAQRGTPSESNWGTVPLSIEGHTPRTGEPEQPETNPEPEPDNLF